MDWGLFWTIVVQVLLVEAFLTLPTIVVLRFVRYALSGK